MICFNIVVRNPVVCVKAFVLESESLFDNKAYPLHSKGLSSKNCMLRVPGSIKSKVNKEVQIIQRWNGRRSSIRSLLEEFYVKITENKINETQYPRRRHASAAAVCNSMKVFYIGEALEENK
jgi:hypothetical protein